MKSFVSFVLLTLMSTTLMAQTSTTSHSSSYVSDIIVSPTVGVIFTDLIFKDSEGLSVDPQAGFAAGINFDILTRSPYIDYQTGLIYSESRSSFRRVEVNSFSRFESEGEYRLRRLSLPLYAKIYPFKKRNRLYTKVGLLLHYMMEIEAEGSNSETYFSTSSVDSDSFSLKAQQGSNLEAVVVDGVIGSGYGLALTESFDLSLEVSYQRGLSALDKSGEVKADTGFLTIGLGF